MSERIVSPEEVSEIRKRHELCVTPHPFNHARWVEANAALIGKDVPALLRTVATEPDRTRAAVVKALRKMSQHLADLHQAGEVFDASWAVSSEADAIENGAPLDA